MALHSAYKANEIELAGKNKFGSRKSRGLRSGTEKKGEIRRTGRRLPRRDHPGDRGDSEGDVDRDRHCRRNRVRRVADLQEITPPTP
jgi:hypothetical protein